MALPARGIGDRHVELPVPFTRFVSPGQAKLGPRPRPGAAPNLSRQVRHAVTAAIARAIAAA